MDEACVSCGAAVSGEYCAACGERRASARDLSLVGFLRDVLHSAFDLDSRLYRSFRTLVARPGLLTVEYVTGRRRLYLSPLQLFLVANLIFFIAEGFVPVVTFDTPLGAHRAADYGQIVNRMLRARFMSFDSPDYAAYQTRFNIAATQQAKSLVILFVPFYAILTALMRALRRDPTRRFLPLALRREPAGKHVAFALHYVAFSLLVFIGTGVVLEVLRLATSGRIADSENMWIPLAVMTVLALYLFPAYRVAYGSRRSAAAVQAVVMALAALPLLTLFRFILFFTVYYTV